MAKTNTGLVEYVNAKVGCYYWFGCFGQMSNQKGLYAAKKAQYPKYYTASDFQYQINHPKQVFDCAGLIKAYLWTDSIDDTTPTYKSSQDYGATGFYNQAKVKGSLPNNNLKVGTLVFKGTDKTKSHVGVYVGNNTVVEAKGHAYGVIRSTFSSGGWKYWAECHLIKYSDEPVPVPPEPAKDQYVVVTKTGDTLKIRKEPTTKSEYVGEIPPKTTVTAAEVVKGQDIKGCDAWIKTTYKGITGYASGKYLEPTPVVPDPTPEPVPEPTTTKYKVETNGGTLSLRNVPKLTGSVIIANIPNGTVLDVTEIVQGDWANGTTDWAHTSYSGKIGYCTCSWLVKLSDGSSAADYYTVVKGDTLWQIAQRFGITLTRILELNKIANPNVIHIGQKIKVR